MLELFQVLRCPQSGCRNVEASAVFISLPALAVLSDAGLLATTSVMPGMVYNSEHYIYIGPNLDHNGVFAIG